MADETALAGWWGKIGYAAGVALAGFLAGFGVRRTAKARESDRNETTRAIIERLVALETHAESMNERMVRVEQSDTDTSRELNQLSRSFRELLHEIQAMRREITAYLRQDPPPAR